MCGIFGGWNIDDANFAAFLGLHHLQHRGQESVGIVTNDTQFHVEKGEGILSGGAITFEELVNQTGNNVIGQNRYSTQGSSNITQSQPLVDTIYSHGEQVAIGHNGQLNGPFDFQSLETDSEQFIIEYHNSRASTLEERVFDMLAAVSTKGTYAISMLVHHPKEGNALVVAKDPHGVRPLCMAQTDNDGYIFASETCALDAVDMCLYPLHSERELDPGEVIIISDKNGFQQYRRDELPEAIRPKTHLPCFFEDIYFARPDSRFYGVEVAEIRENIGRALAREHPADADYVIPTPDSANDVGVGFSEESGIPLRNAIIRSHYIGRTFIDPNLVVNTPIATRTRQFSLSRKFSFRRNIIRGSRIVNVDDSIMRGATQQLLTHSLYKIGATDIDLRIGSPSNRYACVGGIDTPNDNELLAHGKTNDEIRLALTYSEDGNGREIRSLGYISHEATMNCIPHAQKSRCDACLTGNYQFPTGNLVQIKT